MSIKNQVDRNAAKTFNSKLTLDRWAQSQVVVITGYHTYNVVFNASYFMEELLKNQKNIRFSANVAPH